jgi:hypothetical protein
MIQVSTLQELNELQVTILELTKRADAIKKSVKSELTYGEHQFGEFKVTYTQRTRIDLDKEAVTKELGDRVKDFEKISGYDVLLLKKV